MHFTESSEKYVLQNDFVAHIFVEMLMLYNPADLREGLRWAGGGSLGEIKAESIPYLGNSDSRSIRGQL